MDVLFQGRPAVADRCPPSSGRGDANWFGTVGGRSDRGLRPAERTELLVTCMPFVQGNYVEN